MDSNRSTLDSVRRKCLHDRTYEIAILSTTGDFDRKTDGVSLWDLINRNIQ